MESVFSQNLLNLAFWVGMLVILLSFLTAIGISFIHLIRIHYGRRQKNILELWRPLLFQSIEQIPTGIPSLAKGDIPIFLTLWNHYQESLRGESQERLQRLAYQLNIHRAATKMLHHISARKRILAIVTLGHLKEKKAWNALYTIANKPNVLLSFTATRALLHIDAEQAVPFLVQQIVHRENWPMPFIMNLLKEAGADLISPPLIAAAEKAPEEKLPRLFRYLDQAHYHTAIPIVRVRLKELKYPEAIAAGLRFLKDSRDIHFIKKHLSHSFWPVRMHVAKALGKMGSREDVPLLVQLLSDSEWWVRYRAAQALIKLPFFDKEKHDEITKTFQGPAAQQILSQVVAEEALV